jgi:hypothetical protein
MSSCPNSHQLTWGEADALHSMTRNFFFISIILGLFPHWFDLSHDVRNCPYLASQLSAASPWFRPQKSGVESLLGVDRQMYSVLICMMLNRDFSLQRTVLQV